MVEDADLAVEHGIRRGDRVRRSASGIAKALRQVVAVSARERDLAARDRHDRAEAVPLRLEHPALSGRKPVRGGGEHRLVATARCPVVGVLAKEQPVLRIAVERRRNERPHAFEALSVEPHGEPAVALLLEEVVRAAIPDLDGSRAVLSRRNHSREVGVFERMVLDVHREMALALAQRDSLRHRPARESAVSLEPEVVVEATRVVPLDHEARPVAGVVAASERLRCLPRTALTPVLVEAHLWIVARSATRSLPTGCKITPFPCSDRIRGRG